MTRAHRLRPVRSLVCSDTKSSIKDWRTIMRHKKFHRGDAVKTSDGHVGIVREVNRKHQCRIGILATVLRCGKVTCGVDHEEWHDMDTLVRGY